MKTFKSLVVSFFALGILAPGAYGQTTTRPIEDFVDNQGTYCIDDGMGGCFLFVPPIENFFGQSDPSNSLVSSVDYAGLADEWIQGPGGEAGGCGMSFGTTFSGQIKEQALEDGRAAVHVVLHTDNALTWVTDGFDFNNPLLFGSRADDVCNGAEPALGSITMIIKFINSAPGAAMPDLLQLAIEPVDGQEFASFLATRARAKGPLRPAFGVEDGTPGMFNTTQNGLLVNPSNAPWNHPDDGFPVEQIRLKVAEEDGE
jgi:hypothetical protein